MELVSHDSQGIRLAVSRNELMLISNALNEVCNGIDVPEFESRLGATEEEALLLLRKIGQIYDSTGRNNP